jgi:hypothetical protein
MRETPVYLAVALSGHKEHCIYIQFIGAKDEPNENVISLSE